MFKSLRRNILITGASSGIGKALYDSFKRETLDYNVFGLSRRGPDIKLDLSKPYVGPPLMEHIDVLINCAGIMPLDEEDPHGIFQVNFWGMVNMINLHWKNFEVGACIINIASVSGMVSEPFLPIYAASKAAVISYTKSMAKKFAPEVRVNCISPGFYETNLVPGGTPAELISTIPLGYEENPANLFPVVKMIIDCNYMTGSNVVIDGGITL